VRIIATDASGHDPGDFIATGNETSYIDVSFLTFGDWIREEFATTLISPSSRVVGKKSKLDRPKTPIRLVAIDLDGTLLRSDKNLTNHSARAIMQALLSGVQVVLATARPPRSTREIHKHLKLETVTIHYNGAVIYDLCKDRTLYHQSLRPGIAINIAHMVRRIDPQISVTAEILNRRYADHIKPPIPEPERRFVPDYIGPYPNFLHQPVTKLMLRTDAQKMQQIRQAVRQAYVKQVSILVSDKQQIQIMAPGVNKAVTLARVAAYYDIPQSQVMAIGDAGNDATMIQWAGLGVAVANAWPKVLDIADTVVPSNDENGVAFAINEYVLDKKM